MIFSQTLMHWYSNNKRDLPWRETKDPYRIWLSEIILQQTQVKQGLPYYESFIKEFPTVFHLARAKESQVLKLWQGLGYYSRARNLHASAKYMVKELNGTFPTTYNEILKLKGVGDYTASAIASICFGEPTSVVDGNVYRVLSRYFGIKTPINSSKGTKEFKQLAQTLIDRKMPAQFNQAIMEFGAVQCKPQSPDCDICPFQNSCEAFGANIIDELPVKIKAKKVSKKYFNYLVFVSNDSQTILEKREGKGIWQNLYQFPLVETQSEMTPKQMLNHLKDHELVNEIEFELTLYNDESIVHKLSHQHLYTRFWIVETEKLTCQGVSIGSVHNYPVPKLIGNFLDGFNF